MVGTVAGEIAGTWQRWTIDEIDAGLARVAVADSEYPLESGAAEAMDTKQPVDKVRAAVFKVENAPPDDVWGDEQPVYMPVEELREFLKRRAEIRALPDPRPLREGDVFWIVQSPDLDENARRGLTAAKIMDRADKLQPQVWDVTAAARQAAKRTYDDAVRAATDEAEAPPEEAPPPPGPVRA